MKRRQLEAKTKTYYGTILLEEWNLNVITRNGWMEGDLLNFAMSEFYNNNTMPSISTSVYLLKASGNQQLQVTCALSWCCICTYTLLYFLQTALFKHVDLKTHKVLLFPLQAGQHWSLLVLVVKDLVLYSVDSGHSKIFGHSDMQYAPAIGVLEQLLKLDPKAITRSPSHLNCTTQPNSFDCGYHVVLNAVSISEHINATPAADADLTAWAAPTSTPTEVRQYRKELYDKAAALPYAVVLEDGSDSEDEPSDGEPLEID